MSTRCEIAIKRKDGTISSVYHHYDGYIEGVGVDLIKGFNSAELAKKALKTSIDVGEGIEDICEFNSLLSYEDWLKNTDREYAYLWDQDKWYYIKVDWQKVNRNWLELQPEVERLN